MEKNENYKGKDCTSRSGRNVICQLLVELLYDLNLPYVSKKRSGYNS